MISLDFTQRIYAALIPHLHGRVSMPEACLDLIEQISLEQREIPFRANPFAAAKRGINVILRLKQLISRPRSLRDNSPIMNDRGRNG